MVDKQDEIDKAVNIIIATKGTKEATKEVETMHEKSHKGQEQLQRDAKKSAEANDLFTRKWKNQLLMIGGALGALYGLTKYSPVAASMINVLGVALGYLATVILLPMLPYMLQLVGYIIDLADAFTKLDPTVQTIISALTSLALGWAVLKNLPGFDLAKKITFGAADLLKTAAGLGTMSSAVFMASFVAGLLLGFTVGWILFKNGVFSKITEMGAEFKVKFPLLFDIITVVTAPLAILGEAILDVFAAIDRFANGDTAGALKYLGKIPEDMATSWGTVKKILEGWGVPAGLTDLTAALVSLGSAIAYFKLLTKPIAAIKSLISLPGKVVSAVTDFVTGRTGTATKSATSGSMPKMESTNYATGTSTASGSAASTAGKANGAGVVLDAEYTIVSDAADTTAKAAADTASTATKTAGIVEKVTGTVGGIFKGIGGLFGGLEALPSITLAKLSGIGTTDSSAVKVGMNSFASGGYVANDQVAQLHKGDWIRSKYGDTTRDSTGKTDKGSAGNTFNGPINIVTQSSNPREIYRYLNQELGKAARSRV